MKKKVPISTAARISCSIGLVTPTPPTSNTGGRSKMPGPGGVNDSVATKVAAVRCTGSPLSVLLGLVRRVRGPMGAFALVRCGSGVQAGDGQVETQTSAHEDADRDQERGAQPLIQEPADHAVHRHAGGEVTEGVPGIRGGLPRRRWRSLLT